MLGFGARGWLAVGAVAVASACTALDGLSGSPDEPALPARVTACAAEGAPTCGAHGTCTETDGGAVCACAERYAGPTCSACAPGFQDDDHDGTCDLVCGSVSCTAHQVCDTTSGTPTCACATGYAPENGACVWKGTLKDPGFQDMPAGSWSLDGGVRLDPTAPALVSPGLARIPKAACAPGRIQQSFPMPTVAEGEPLAIDVSAQMRCQPPPPGIPGGIQFPCFGFVYRLGFRGRFQSGAFTSSIGTAPVSVKDHICLGERAFGGTTDLEMRGECNFWEAEEAIDHAVIVPDPECPLPGQIPNGDFEGTGGWKVSGALAEIAATGGNKGSRAGHLATSKLCDSASLLGLISSPQSTPHPALVMTVKGTMGKTMSVGLGLNGPVATITGSNVFDKVSICLPEWSRGLAMQLLLTTQQPSSGTCGDPGDPTDFLFDDLSIVSDAACADPGWVVDGGFELAGPWRVWSTGAGITFARGGGAHAGSGYLALTATGTNGSCNSVTSGQYITVPDANANAGVGGPAVRYFYRSSAAGTPTVSMTGGPGDPLTSSATWTQATRCLDPNLAGQRSFVSFSVSGSANCTSASLYVDDVEAVLDPACPK